MALVAFLRGVNVGGHRRFRPSLLANELRDYGAVNVGATGILVVRNARSPSAFRAELLRRLPFETDVALFDGRELIELLAESPFGAQMSEVDSVPFVSILTGSADRRLPSMPIDIPASGEWFVRIMRRHKRFVFGCYRRHMKTIGYLGRIDNVLGARVTTRKWDTILSVVRVLERL
jgi:uncharacterized protein (DUF1697 family)